MQWFVAKIIFRIVVGGGEHHPQFDEQVRLVQALHGREAWAKARQLGEKLQERFLNLRQQWVYWQFVEVTEINCLDALADGCEVYYQINEPENLETYLSLVHQKAAALADRIQADDAQTDIVLSA